MAWKISEITRDYKKFPDFLDQVQKYDDFCNEPNWNGSYQRVINNCFNICEPLKWKTQEGSIVNTISFLKHLFGGEGRIILDDQGKFEKEEAFLGDQFTVALDYLTIMLKHPKQMLPVPCLVSPEQGTGKSTFLYWLQMIFGNNMCILGNAQFQMKFNGHYATKYIISIDEGFLEVDKKAEKERLKQLVTTDSIYLEHKGMNVRKIAYYAKIIIASNDADRLMKIDDGESRWFVVRVPVIPKEKKDPDLQLKMKGEAEAWLHFLFNRQIFHPRKDRLWFNPEHFITDQYRVIVESTKNRLDRIFEEWLREQFFMFRLPILKYSLGYLTKVFNDNNVNKYKVDKLDLRNYLIQKNVKYDKKVQRFKMPSHVNVFDELSDKVDSITFKEPDNPTFPYIFEIEKWLTEEEINTRILPFADPHTGSVKQIGFSNEIKKTDDLPF